MTNEFRPWGSLQWLLNKVPGSSWGLLGVLGTEDRCTAVLTVLNQSLVARKFLRILDPHLSPENAFEERFAAIERTMVGDGAFADEIVSVDLLQDIDTIEEEVSNFLKVAGPRIILDITSMPKRWFFPVVRFLMADTTIETLIVTYTSAQSYGEQLSSDPEALRALPTYDEPRSNERYDELVIGVGFAPLGLRDLFEADIGRIRYLFPFPPGPPHFFRNWHFLRRLESEVENLRLRVDDRWHVHMYDVPTAFEALRKITKNGAQSCALAPFGPKPLSLAMCLFALAAARAGKEPVHVYYTQPRRYSLDYSTGIKMAGGSPDIKAYCLRVGGRDQYIL